MSITKRKNSPHWHYEFVIAGERFRGSTFTTDKRLAAEYEAKLKTEAYRQRKLGGKADIKLGQAMERYWMEHAKNLSSADSIWGYLGTFGKVWGADTYMSEIDDARFSELQTYLQKRGSRRGKKSAPLGASTYNNYFICFRSMYSKCKNKWKLNVAEIDFSEHKLLRPDHRVRYLSVDEFKAFYAELAEHLKDLVIFDLLSGVRKTNCVDLIWRQIDWHERIIDFKIKSRRPGGANHTVEMSDELHLLLLAIFEKQKAETGAVNLDAYVFQYKGRKLSSDNRTGFKAALRRAGIKNFTFHDLRHTFGSWLIQDNKNLGLVKELLGHKNIQTTLKYAHLAPSGKRDALNDTFSKKMAQIPRREVS